MNRKRIGQIVWGAGTFLLLSACSSFTGLQKEMYDGKTIFRDEAAISAYSERLEIIGKEKINSFGTQMPDYFLHSPLPFLNHDAIELSGEPKRVGKDLPAGRYVIEKPEFEMGATLVIRDEEENILLQEVLGFYLSHIELDLHQGETVQMIGQNGSALNAVSSSSASYQEENKSSISLPNGVWRVGEHLPAGSYYLSGSDTGNNDIPFLYVINEDGTFRLFELWVDFHASGSYEIPVELKEGQVLYLKNTPLLTFRYTK